MKRISKDPQKPIVSHPRINATGIKRQSSQPKKQTHASHPSGGKKERKCCSSIEQRTSGSPVGNRKGNPDSDEGISSCKPPCRSGMSALARHDSVAVIDPRLYICRSIVEALVAVALKSSI